MAWFRRKAMLEPGAQAPDFELPTIEGGSLSLKQILARGPALIGFFKVTCPVCQMTWPYLEHLNESGGDGAVQIIGISQDNARATQEYNRQYGITFPTLLDDPTGYRVSNAFQIDTVPSLFLVETDGRISRSVSGFSKRELEALGQRMGAQVFQPDDRVPEFRPG